MLKEIKIQYSFWGNLKWTIALIVGVAFFVAFLKNPEKILGQALSRSGIVKSYCIDVICLILCALIILRFIFRCISPTAIIACENGIYTKLHGFISWENIEHISLRKKITDHRRFKNIERYITIKIKDDRLIEPKTIIQKIRRLLLPSDDIKISPLAMDVEKTACLLKNIYPEKRKMLKATCWYISYNKEISIILESRRQGFD